MNKVNKDNNLVFVGSLLEVFDKKNKLEADINTIEFILRDFNRPITIDVDNERSNINPTCIEEYLKEKKDELNNLLNAKVFIDKYPNNIRGEKPNEYMSSDLLR